MKDQKDYPQNCQNGSNFCSLACIAQESRDATDFLSNSYSPSLANINKSLNKSRCLRKISWNNQKGPFLISDSSTFFQVLQPENAIHYNFPKNCNDILGIFHISVHLFDLESIFCRSQIVRYIWHCAYQWNKKLHIGFCLKSCMFFFLLHIKK